jgi:chaperonin GroEL (HSP60 family)
VLFNLALEMKDVDDIIVNQIIFPSLLSPFYRLLNNAGYSEEEVEEVFDMMLSDTKKVYDVENAQFGDPKKLGIYDATLAVKQSLINAVSISSVMGTLGGIICEPRDNALEIQESRDVQNFNRTLENADNLRNEANYRP